MQKFQKNSNCKFTGGNFAIFPLSADVKERDLWSKLTGFITEIPSNFWFHLMIATNNLFDNFYLKFEEIPTTYYWNVLKIETDKRWRIQA